MTASNRQAFAGYRAVSIGSAPVDVRSEAGEGGTIWYLRCTEPLQAHPLRLTDCLIEGAGRHPERTLVARRGADGEWVRICYADMLARARAIGQALLERGLSPERPLLILSGNDLEHLQLALGAMLAGVPYCPMSPAASLVSSDFGKLAHALSLLTPGMVYATEGEAYARAIRAKVPESVEVVVGQGAVDGRSCTHLDELLATVPRDIDAVHHGLGPDTIAKFLFTSGSTKLPKAVTTTHRMLCANQQMLLQTFPCFGEVPPVLVDWLPWNHTFGGSHNVGIALYNGGSYYIDDGRPTPQGMAETLRNLRDVAPTVFFNVPKGWELLTEALEQDAALRDTFYSRVKMFLFAGAGLSQAAWDRLERVSEAHCGERIRIMSGLGMTETSPSCTFTTGPEIRAGYVGLPVPGCEVRLVPVDGKLEARFRGPHVMPGYWRAPEQTHEAFDGAGFYRTGDALKWVDVERPELGLLFDGRIAEDFKLSSGTFVSVGPLRARLISEGAPYVQDVVVTGINRDDIGVMIFPRLEHCSRLAGLSADAPAHEILAAAPVRTWAANLLARANQGATGSASRVARLRLLEEAPAIDAGEITDKGSINQRAVLARRAALVEAMYDGSDPHTLTIA
ncbi:MAG: feruloyl-CoA synthase [Rhodocyclaceae bacterium]